ncbi:MAG: hypothetical protein ABI744_01440 [Chloroflexota bacterium]
MTRIRLALALTTIAVLICACGGSGPAASGDAGCPAVQVSGPDGQLLDLSGAWSGNDGGLYYIKQLGTCVWWSGLSDFDGQYPGQEWIMTFRGTMNSDGQISGDFVDVKSTNPGSGTMTIEARIDQVNGTGVVQLYRTAATGHPIGVTFWQRTTEPTPTDAPTDPIAPTVAPS